MRFLHPAIVVVISIGAAALAAVIGNDYYLRIGFMMCVYYLCAAGMALWEATSDVGTFGTCRPWP